MRRSRWISCGSAVAGACARCPRPASIMMLRRFDAGEQRDLRVPSLDRQRRVVLEAEPAVAVGDDFLRRQVEADPAARGLEVASQRPDLAQQRERRVGPAAVERGAARPGSRARRGCGQSRVRGGPRWSRRSSRVRSSTGARDGSWSARRLAAPWPTMFGQHRRATVGEVERHAARERFAVERAAGRDERGDVGDRVVDTEPSWPASRRGTPDRDPSSRAGRW